MAVLALLVSVWTPTATAGGGLPGLTGNPVIEGTHPADGETGVGLMASVYVRFSNPMNASSVTVAVSPALVSLTPEWDGDLMVNYTHTAPFPECTSISIRVNGTDAFGLPLVPGPVPNPWTFTTFCLNPFIISTDPADGEANVPLNKAIAVTFSEPMNAASVVVAVTPNPGALSYTWSKNNTVVAVSHATPFSMCTMYTVTVTGVDLSGLPLVPGPVPNPWDFSTVLCNPYIVSTSPSDGETGVSVTAPIVVTFSTAMDVATVTLTLAPAHLLTASWDVTRTVVTMTHATAFAPCTTYTATVAGKDTSGLPLGPGPVPNPWSFSTATCTPTILSSYPEDGAIDVPLNASIVVQFSTPMNTSTVLWTLAPARTLIPTWDPTDTVLTLGHPAPFAPCTHYTIEVSGRDVGGDPLVPGPVPNPWSFLTAACAGPRVLSTVPADGATNVSVNATIVVEFSAPMDPGTVTWTIDPAVALTPSWDPTGTVLTLSHATPFGNLTLYTVTVDGKGADGSPLSPGPYTWRFLSGTLGIRAVLGTHLRMLLAFVAAEAAPRSVVGP